MAVSQLPVVGVEGQSIQVDATVDTGFLGWLTLPSDQILALGWPWRRRGNAVLADGTKILFDTHEATILWHGQLRTIPVDVAEVEPLVGMSLLYGSDLHIHAADGGQVRIIAFEESPPE